jgi:hypothetical protein
VSNHGSGNQSQARAVARNIFSLADREPVQVKTCKGRVLIGAPQAHLLQLAFKPIDAIAAQEEFDVNYKGRNPEHLIVFRLGKAGLEPRGFASTASYALYRQKVVVSAPTSRRMAANARGSSTSSSRLQKHAIGDFTPRLSSSSFDSITICPRELGL